MNCLFNYNSEIKKLEVSAQTACKWSCVVTNGNITLDSYYGNLADNDKKEISLFTYGTVDMNGTVVCKFEKDDCVIKQTVSIPVTSLHVFNVLQTNVYLFGENTKTYLQVYYGTLNKSDRNILSTLSFIINNEIDFTYDGDYDKKSISGDSVHLYDMEILPYNLNACSFEIIITSKCEYVFNDKIIIQGKDSNNATKQIVINLTQNIVSNAPTLLKISPSFVFLDSRNLKQKITVTSIYQGAPKGYILTDNIPDSNQQRQQYSNDVEAYLNSTSIMPLKNDDLDISLVTQEKNATHFVLNMTPYNNQQSDNVDNTGDTAYELYVVQTGNPSCYQKLEFFYNYIFDPTNYIDITKIEGVYGYTSNENVFVSTQTINSNDIPNPLTLYFTKDEKEITNPQKGYVYAKYSTSSNVELTINSMPAWWKIHSLSDYVKEVKQNDKLQIALEDTIPSEGTSVSLINEKGYVVSIFCKSDSDIFSNNNSIFGFIDGDNIVSNQECVVSSATTYFTLQSKTEEQKWYYYDTLKEISKTSKTISLPTILYEKNVEDLIVNETLVNYDFEILYNSDIAKYYVIYGSITKKVNGEIELKDNNRYYCNKVSDNELNVIIPLPEKTNFVPWIITNRGYGIVYDIYEKDDNSWRLINNNAITYKPISANTLIAVNNVLSAVTSLRSDTMIQIVPHNSIPNINTTSAIIFQQMNTLKEINLFLTLNIGAGNNPSEYTSLYGDTVSLNNMSGTTDTLAEAINSPFIKDIKEVTSLYYASYYKTNSFQTSENNDISLSILKEYKAQTSINKNIKLSNKNAKLFYCELIDASNQSLSQKWENICDVNNGGREIASWKIENGLLYATINGTQETFFPQNNKEDYINNDGENEGFIFSKNEIAINDSETTTEKWFAIQYSYVDKIINDNISYTKWGDYMEKQCVYPIIEKSFEINGIVYELDKQNILNYIDPNDGQYYKYVGYQDGDKWYINFNNVSYNITYKNNKLIINDDENWALNSNNEFIKDGVVYYPRIKLNLNGLTLNVLTNIDDEKEDFIIINNKKYISNSKKVDGVLKSFIVLNSTVSLEVQKRDNHKYVTFDFDYFIDIIIEPAYKYVVINNEICKLTNNNILIYESKKYLPILQHGEQYVILDNNKGYKVKTQSYQNYIILNYNKYSYELSANTFTIPSYSSKGDEVICEEIANETFNYELNFDDLLSNNIISGKHNNINISNGYVSIINDNYFNNNIYTIQKERTLDENSYPIEIITNEKVDLIGKVNNTLTAITFVDDTYVILSNNESVFYRGNSITNDSRLMNQIITINDYSEIKFNGSCKLTVKNDCVIEYSGQTYNLLENETLIIDTELPIIFTDVTKILIEKMISNEETSLYVFKDAVMYNNNNLYIATTINNKKSITVNNEVYYIYDNKVKLPNDEEIICYEKSILYKRITNNGIQSYVFEVFNFTDENNKPSYGYITNCDCENGNRNGASGIVSLPQKYSVNSYISIFCENVSNNDYVTPLNGVTVILWFEADASLETNRTTSLRVSTNFGLNNPILDFQIPNNEFIVYGNDGHERFYANGNKITYGGVIYDIQKDANGKFVEIGDRRCKVQKSSSLCYGIKVFLSGDYYRLDKKVRLLLNASIKQNENFNYFITLPYFNNEKWQIEEKPLSSITIYQRNDFNYSKAIVVGHTNLGNIEIENGKLNFSIDCYKISGNSISQYTNKQQHYEITVNGNNYSIWDYYANTYVKKLYLNVLNNTDLTVIKNITLNNIKHEIDQNKYVKVKGEYLPIYEVQNYQEIVCPNGSKQGGAGVGHFTTNYNPGDIINVRCAYKGIENETYAAPLNGTTLLCWYKPDKNIETYENKITYEIMSLNFGLNEPIFNYTISNGDFILFDPSNDKRRRYYLKRDSNGKYVEYKSVKYYISGETSTSKGYTIIPYIDEQTQETKYDTRYVYSSNAQCYGLKIFLNTGKDVTQNTALSVYTSSAQTSYDINGEDKNYVIFYENELYKSNNNSLQKINYGSIFKIQQSLVLIPQLNKIEYTNETNGLVYVSFDIDAYLTFNFNYIVSNEKYGVVNKFLISNNVSVEHEEYILFKAKKNINNNDGYTYGLYQLRLLPI